MKWIISDIHGCYYTLLKLHSKVSTLDDEPEFIYVGDYFDRGIHSNLVVDYLSKCEGTFLRGNHDDVMDYLLNDESGTPASEWVWGKPDINKVANWWMVNGLQSTLDAYGVESSPVLIPYGGKDFGNVIAEFKEKVPEEHKKFVRNLKLWWESDTHFSCHAYMRTNVELPRSLNFIPSDWAYEMVWSRFTPDPLGGIHSQIAPKWDKIGVFGHTPVKFYQMVAPIRHHNIRLIDTGVYQKEYLVAYCCERDDFVTVAYELRDLEATE